MWSRKQQFSDSRNLKTDCIKKHPTGNTNIAFTSYQQVAARRVQILATSTLRVGTDSKNIGFIPSLVRLVARKKSKVKTIYHNRIATLIKDSNIAVTVPNSSTPIV
jgi:hypothetical protein